MAVQLKTLATVTVATAGTEQPLSATPVDKVVKVWLSAPAANTGNVFVGENGSVSSTRGLIIVKGTTEVIYWDGEYIDLQNIYVDVGTSGDKVQVAYLYKTT